LPEPTAEEPPPPAEEEVQPSPEEPPVEEAPQGEEAQVPAEEPSEIPPPEGEAPPIEGINYPPKTSRVRFVEVLLKPLAMLPREVNNMQCFHSSLNVVLSRKPVFFLSSKKPIFMQIVFTQT